MIGDEYSAKKWKRFVDWLLEMLNRTTSETPNALCPLCDEGWEIERGEDLCHCQFFKRSRA